MSRHPYPHDRTRTNGLMMVGIDDLRATCRRLAGLGCTVLSASASAWPHHQPTIRIAPPPRRAGLQGGTHIIRPGETVYAAVFDGCQVVWSETRRT
jgi:hypothetical protein